MFAISLLLGFVFFSSGLHKLKMPQVRWKALGILEFLLSLAALFNVVYWAVVSTIFLTSILVFRVWALRKTTGTSGCNCGVPSFGTNYRRDTKKVLALCMVSLLAVFTYRADGLTVARLAGTVIVAGVSIVLVKTNPMRPTASPGRNGLKPVTTRAL